MNTRLLTLQKSDINSFFIQFPLQNPIIFIQSKFLLDLTPSSHPPHPLKLYTPLCMLDSDWTVILTAPIIITPVVIIICREMLTVVCHNLTALIPRCTKTLFLLMLSHKLRQPALCYFDRVRALCRTKLLPVTCFGGHMDVNY